LHCIKKETKLPDMKIMLFKNKKILSPTIWLLISLFSTQFLSLGYVICIETDRFVEIEAACNCRQENSHNVCSQATSSINSELTTINDHCGPCVDILVSINTDTFVISRQSTVTNIKASILGALSLQKIIFIDTLLDVSKEKIIFQQPPEFNTIIASLQTVILHC
jgi:hypothetical protein